MKNAGVPLAAALLALASMSCTGLRATLDNLQHVQRELTASVGQADYRAQLTNGRVLTIGVLNSAWQPAPPAEKSAKAKQIAQLAWNAYPDRSSLTGVQVNFVQHKQILGVSVDSTSDAFRFSVGELQSAAR